MSFLKGFPIRHSILLVGFLVCFNTYAKSVDTTFFSDGGVGPYRLGTLFIDSTTIQISFPDSVFQPPWVYISDINSILFSEPIDSGLPVRITYDTDYYGLSKIYSLFEKKYESQQDTTVTLSPKRIRSIYDNETLNISGYKSVGVSIGNLGQVNFEQGLDINISGNIRPETQLKAHLSDEATSIDGATREISEFDMIYIALTNPKFDIIAGDQYISWPFRGILNGDKKIKGISASLHPKDFSVKAFGALSGGKYTVQTFHGKNGIQGPYTLTGNNELDLIMIVSGTVKVTINGLVLHEGEDKDFIADYDLGTVKFTPNILVKEGDLIRVEYEYKLFDYQRVLLGTHAEFASPDSLFSIQGALWSETDNRKHPIDISFSPQDLSALKNGGDKPVYGTGEREINPNDVPTYDAKYRMPLYSKIIKNGETVFVYNPYNPRNPNDVKGRYNVNFSYVGKNNGSYKDSVSDDRTIYIYTGNNSGDFSPNSPLSKPQRVTNGEVKANLDHEYIKATVNFAGQDIDKNLFSSLDDDDNRSSSARASLTAGKKQYNKKSIWFSGDYNFISERFEHEAISLYDRHEQWDDSTTDSHNTRQQLWESAFGITPFGGLSTEFLYGQNRSGNKLLTDKFGNNSYLMLKNILSLQYKTTWFRHIHVNEINRKETARLNITPKNHSLGFIYQDQWLTDSLKNGRGEIEWGIEYQYLPWNFSESFTYSKHKSGNNGLLASADTGYSLLWEQSFNNKIMPQWQIWGSSSYHKHVTTDKNKSSTFLIDLKNQINSSSDNFNLNQQYRSSSEKASIFVQVPRYIGSGLGTHIYDDSLREYVPHIPGDYYMEQKEIYDSTELKIRKTTMNLSWSYSPSKKTPGILGDLYWEGYLFLEEHIMAENNSFSSWFPGYISLKNINSKIVKNVEYSDLSYRQDITWNPKKIGGLSANLLLLPSLRQIRSYKESALETGINLDTRKNRWTFGTETRFQRMFHDDTSSKYSYSFKDINIEFQQKFRIGNTTEIFLKECLGWARKYDTLKTGSIPSDSSIYYQIKPGLSFRPFGKGWAEASYTFSKVNLPEGADYRMARGNASGISHIISFIIDIQAGEHFLINGTYRGEFNRSANISESVNHILSLEAKAFL